MSDLSQYKLFSSAKREGIGWDSDSDNDTWLCLASRWDSSGQVAAGDTAATFDLAKIQPAPLVGNILWHITLVLAGGSNPPIPLDYPCRTRAIMHTYD